MTTEDSLATCVHGFVIDIDGEPHGLRFVNGHWDVIATDGGRTELADAVERAAAETAD
ncbi:hypothetical protein [Halovivax limisalsi]|uniref:hypothetical protein n=1 Tax=Halovivax limisalsi TaxID=1453760 RepID=UPI001FFC55FE|nr:hypothetical protein [Halovivax limisalsi]